MNKYIVPDDLKLEERLTEAGYTKLLKPLHKDKLYRFISLLRYKILTRREKEAKDAFFELKSTILKECFSRSYYQNVIRPALDMGIVECDFTFMENVKCKGYRLSPKFARSNYVSIPRFETKLARNDAEREKKHYEKLKNTHAGMFSMVSSLELLDFDCDAASRYVQQESRKLRWEQVCAYEMQIESLRSGENRIARDEQGRFYHKFVNLPRVLRSFIVGPNGIPLFSCDVVCSQPCFLGKYVECPAWIAECERAGIYPFVNSKSSNPVDMDDPIVKGEFKASFYAGCLYCKNGHEGPIAKIVKEYFPDVYETIRKYKLEKHNELALMLQRDEAWLIIDVIAKEFAEMYPEAYLFSIHDSLVTTEEYIMRLKSLMQYHLKKVA